MPRFELVYHSGAGTYSLKRPWRRLNSLQVRRVILPTTFNSFEGGSLLFKEDAGTTLSAAIPAGTYTSATLGPVLEAAMGTASGLGRTYSWAIAATTGLYSCATSAGTVQILGATSDATLAAMVGFQANSTDALTVVADSVAQPVGLLTHVYLCSPQLAAAMLSPLEDTSGVANAITSVPLSVDAYALNVWESPLPPAPVLTNGSSAGVSDISFTLARSDTGAALNLRGADFSVSLEVDVELA